MVLSCNESNTIFVHLLALKFNSKIDLEDFSFDYLVSQSNSHEPSIETISSRE